MEETHLFPRCCGSETAAGPGFLGFSAASLSFMSGKHLLPLLFINNLTDQFPTSVYVVLAYLCYLLTTYMTMRFTNILIFIYNKKKKSTLLFTILPSGKM